MRKDSREGLVRALGLGALIIYGVGDILGAGIYSIIGKIAGHAGSLTWLSFAIAMAIVFFTALSYAELGSRFPRSGGVSIYIQEAFNRKWLSILAGLLLFSATVLSMSTLSQAFAGYLSAFGWQIPNWLGVTLFLTLLMFINLRGIKQSSIANIISTMVEVSGLLIVLICGVMYLATTSSVAPSVEVLPSMGDVMQGAALAFFAFTGFEDMANIAEEVQQPEKNLPRAILSSLGAAGILYLSVSWIATAVIPGTALGQSSAPLLDVVKKSYPALPHYVFTLIAIFAVSNTTLLNYITASRLLYGMSEDKLLPKVLFKVHSKFHTPYVAIFFIFPIVWLLGILGSLKGLAGSTSAVVLTVFSFSCIALINVKLKERKNPRKDKVFRIPMFVPWAAVALNITAIAFLPLDNLMLAAAFIAAGVVVSWLVLKGDEAV